MESKELQLTNVFLGIIVVFATGVLLYQLQSVLLPFILAIFLSYIFKPFVLYLKKKKIPAPLALLMVFIFISGLFFGLSVIVYSSFESFIREAPKYQDKLSLILRELTLKLDHFAARFDIKPENFGFGDLVDFSALTSVVTSGAGSVFSGLGNIFLILLLMFFILAGSGDLVAKVRYSMVKRHSQALSAMLVSIDQRVRQYLIAKTLISLATGALTTGILIIFGVDFALLWGFLTFLLNFIPNIGSIVAIIFPITISFLQFDSVSTPLLILALLAVTQGIMGNVVEPKVMEFSLNLSPLLVLVALIFWGWLWGIWGMILAVPIMSILKIIFENIEPLKPIGVLMSGSIPSGRHSE
ncbi:MAG: AI-2E family transporter [Bacteroidetes bacterium]|nr:AI-2E family transporter [Bacteroidota bacterium]